MNNTVHKKNSIHALIGVALAIFARLSRGRNASIRVVIAGIAMSVTTVVADNLTAQMESAFIELRGNAQQGGLMVGQTQPGARVWLDDQVLPVSSDGHVVFGFGRDDKGARRLTVQLPDGRKSEQALQVSVREYQIQKITGVAQKYVEPDPEMVARTKKEAAMISQARAQTGERTDFLEGFLVPAEGPVTGVYGSQRYFNGQPRRPHFGVDYAAPVGTPVIAPASGIVRLVHRDMFYSGGTLLVDHGMGVSSTFIHLSDILVSEGDEVRQGQMIARVGKTGRVTGAHLDWRINWGTVRIDPQLVLKAFPAPLNAAALSDKSATVEKQ